MKFYLITFTKDKGITYQTVSVPAKNLTDAYIELQLRIPGAEITAVKLSGKMATFGDIVWLDILAEHLVKHATVEQSIEVMNHCDPDMKLALSDAIWNTKRKLNERGDI